MIHGLAHICFRVRDLAAATDFYCNKLGLKEAFEFTNAEGRRSGLYIHVVGRTFIELFQGDVVEPLPAQGYKHFCLEVDDVTKTVAELRSRGVDASDPKFGKDNSWQAWLSDPDGNRIELHSYTPKSWQTPSLK